MSYSDFSSWPRDQEQQFVVFEQRGAESSKKALTIGVISGAALLFISLGIYAGIKPEHKDLTKGMNMDNLTKKSKKAEAPAPTPDPPKAEAKPAEAPAAAPAAPAAPATETK